MKNSEKRVRLLYDAVRSPYDIAHIIQIGIALNCVIYTSGNSISFDNKKIVNKVQSWNINEYPEIINYDTFEDAVKDLQSKNYILVGTSGNAKKSFYNRDYSDGNTVIVFGTESSGLTKYKQELLNDLVKLPMSNKADFLTLPVATAAIAYEINRQFIFNG